VTSGNINDQAAAGSGCETRFELFGVMAIVSSFFHASVGVMSIGHFTSKSPSMVDGVKGRSDSIDPNISWK
jgi:hypothetical protein